MYLHLNKSLAITNIFFLIGLKCTIHFVLVEFIMKMFLKIDTKMLHFLRLVFICLLENTFDEHLV